MVAVLEERIPEPEPEPGICHLLMERDRKARKPPCGTTMFRVGKEGEQGKDWVYICPKCDPGYLEEHSDMVVR